MISILKINTIIKRWTSLCLAFNALSGLTIYSQELIGIHSSQSFQLQNLNYQPAEILHNGSKWDINILTFNAFSQNKIVFENSDFFDTASKLGMPDLQYLMGNNNSNMDTWAEIQLPSFSYQISHKSAVAFSTNIRANAVYRASNDAMMSMINDEPIDLNNYPQNGVIESILNTWFEVNGTYAHLILNTEKHQIKGGITLKYIVGAATGYLNIDNIELEMADANEIEKLSVDFSYGSNSTLNALVEEQTLKLGQNRGMGMDFGAIYNFKSEKFKEAFNPNLIKVGFAIADIGYIKHHNTPNQKTLTLTGTNISTERFNGINSITELADTLRSIFNISEGDQSDLRINLRTNYKVYADYQFYKNWAIHVDYLYLTNTYQNLLPVMPKSSWRGTFTPRYESSTWGVYSPVTYHSIQKWYWGLSFKYRSFFFGSGALLSNLISKEPKHNNVYFGVNIAIR